MRNTRVKLSDQIRRAVNDSKLSRYAISQSTKIDQAVLCRFVAGKHGMLLGTIDVLADLLNLNIVAGEPPTLPPPLKRGRKPKRKVGKP